MKHKFIILLPVFLLVICCGYPLWAFASLQWFYNHEARANPFLDAMNNDIFAQLGTPANGASGSVAEAERKIIGNEHAGSKNHGRWLMVTYNIYGLPKDAIIEHYDTSLLSRGWVYFEQYEDGNMYIRGTYCIRLMLFSSRYSMLIWQDYFSQPFTPNPPPLWMLYLNELGESQIATCPPR